MSAENLIKAIAATAELTTTHLSAIAQATMAKELMLCNADAVVVALQRCSREVRPGGFTLGAVLERIDDGRPGADEAWALALDAQDEACTVVWCAEIQQAFAIARPVLTAGDKIGARMAFRNAYDRLVRDARMQRKPAQWSPSLGWDQGQRHAVLTRAVETGMLTKQSIAGLLPAPSSTGPIAALLLGAPSHAGGGLPVKESAEVVRRCAEIRENLATARAESARRRREEQDRQRADLAARKAAAAAAVAAALTNDHQRMTRGNDA